MARAEALRARHDVTNTSCTYGKVVVCCHGEPNGRTGAHVLDLVFTHTERVETIDGDRDKAAVQAKPYVDTHALPAQRMIEARAMDQIVINQVDADRPVAHACQHRHGIRIPAARARKASALARARKASALARDGPLAKNSSRVAGYNHKNGPGGPRTVHRCHTLSDPSRVSWGRHLELRQHPDRSRPIRGHGPLQGLQSLHGRQTEPSARRMKPTALSRFLSTGCTSSSNGIE